MLAIAPVIGFMGRAHAETYKGLEYWMTLGEVKKLFPNGTLKAESPAWAQESDALYTLTGPGITGEIVIKFEDSRPIYRRILSGVVITPVDSAIAANPTLETMASEPDDEALTIAWVRWMPVVAIPLTRLVAKYGPIESSGFTDDDFQPYREWESRGLTAFLDDKMLNVERIDFRFTQKELKAAIARKYGLPSSPRRVKSKSNAVSDSTRARRVGGTR